jgi:MOSC domain-containing protein YiiM
MTVSGRCGWYFRVITEGEAPTRDAVLARIATGSGPHLRDVFHAVFNRRLPPEHRAGIAAMPSLAQAWRDRLA